MKVLSLNEELDNLMSSENPFLQDAKNEVKEEIKHQEEVENYLDDEKSIEYLLGVSKDTHCPDEIKIPETSIQESLINESVNALYDKVYESVYDKIQSSVDNMAVVLQSEIKDYSADYFDDDNYKMLMKILNTIDLLANYLTDSLMANY